ncbi:benzoate/H(+) symporter BenE family transporter [Cellulomonas sp. HZM]|uniref:benzoate/H(+) symporter BenE family transporter n=1 Tax=Cellulomonas sp. HZM TaxID=1454010 RepID=UPI000492F9AE|nr:benzoate/H(+) symporter BenE family transporter [Cellulomonas sp. HZM]
MSVDEREVAPPVTERRSLRADVSLSAVVAGFVAVLVSYTGPFLVVLQAARTAGLSTEQTTSWVWAISVGSGLTCLVLSWATRQPVITAWSTPGAALLVASLGSYRFSDAVGAYVVAALVAVVLGFSGWFGRLLALLPRQLTSALLAGVLLPFVVAGAVAVGASPVVAGGVVVAFVLARRLVPRYAVLCGLVVGAVLAVVTGALGPVSVGIELAGPRWTTPTLSLPAVVGIGLPLLVVTMASQNAPGLTVLRNDGYEPDDRALVGWTSATWLATAPFGGHGINLAAITAAICTGRESHPDPRRRYVAGIACGAFYLLFAGVAHSVVALFQAVPAALVGALAGTALLASLVGSLRDAFGSGDPRVHEAAAVTLAVTVSGVSAWSIGSAFWGLVAGAAVWVVACGRRSWLRRRARGAGRA